MMDVEKSRASAREAVSSRWATRAETSSRMKKQRQEQQQQQQESVCSDSNNDPAASSSSSSYESSTTIETDNFKNMNIIHATWRQIQHSLGWSQLHQLDKEQKRKTRRRHNKQIGNDDNRNPNSRTRRSSVAKNSTTINTKQQSNVNGGYYSGNGTKTKTTQEEKSMNKAKNAQMLANTLTQMRVTTALQSQLESITNQNYDDGDDDDDENDYYDNNNDDNKVKKHHPNNNQNNKKHNYLRSIVSILPTGFDESSALIKSIQHRKRAFFLIDFGQVIKSHAQFLSYTCGFEDQIPVDGSTKMKTNNDGNDNNHLKYSHLPPTHRLKRTVAGINSVMKRRKGIYIQPQFSVTKNPNIELLKLLVRLGVDLRCNSSDDIMTASQAIREEYRNRDDHEHDDVNSVLEEEDQLEEGDQEHHGDQGSMVLVDDASKTRKPNGYFRRLLQTRRPGQHEDLEVTVDDVDEVKRISNTIRQLAKRNNIPNNNRCCKMNDNNDDESRRTKKKTSCRFMLRLPLMNDNEKVNDEIHDGDDHNNPEISDMGLWETLILNVYAAAKEEGGELFGVSVDLSQWSQLLTTSSSNPIANHTASVNTIVTEEKKSEETTTTTTSIKASNVLYKICTRLRLFRLLLLSVGQYHIRIDITGLPPILTRENCDLLTTTLSNVVSSTVTFDELKQIYVSTTATTTTTTTTTTTVDDDDSNTQENETLKEKLEDIVALANDPATCSLFYTADVSTHLVARAGALCARIIGSKVTTTGGGVKQQQKQLDSTTLLSISVGFVGIDDNNNSKNQSLSNKETTHYFIDDGCYGSLGSSSSSSSCKNSTQQQQQKHTPFHLYGNVSLPKSKSHLSLSVHSSYSKSISRSSSIDEKTSFEIAVDSTNTFTTNTISSTTSNNGPCTVWGPTCDGLDKVCESVYLPKDLEANRDWLVFSNLGCGGFGGGLGLGTAFNGFDPPDVEYCVLGYFSGGNSSGGNGSRVDY